MQILPKANLEITDVVRSIVAVVVLIVAIIVGFEVFNAMKPSPAAFGWQLFAALAVAMVVAFAVVGLARLAIGPSPRTTGAATSAADADHQIRSRIAPTILTIGSIAITLLAFLIIVTFSVLAYASGDPTLKGKIDTLIMGVFTAVIPVFATWVGTVLAFYFTNESFRQAAQSVREATAPAAAEPVTDRMIPYAKIVKYLAKRADVRDELLAKVVALFSDQATVIPVFDEAQAPIFIVRKKLVPDQWMTGMTSTPPANNTATGKPYTIDDYVKLVTDESKKYAHVAATASVDTARAERKKANARDVFVTLGGQSSEPTLGWVPEDKLL